MRKIKTGFCSDAFYSQVLGIMREVTGLEWGFVEYRRCILYCVCGSLGYKIAKPVAGKKTPRVNHIVESEENLRGELCKRLLEYVSGGQHNQHLPNQHLPNQHLPNQHLPNQLISKLSAEVATKPQYYTNDKYADTLPRVDSMFAAQSMSENRWMLPKELSRDDYI
jgi:hypothetical protein